MIAFDVILFDFLKGNILTINLILAILKIIAIETETVVDDKIIQLITGVFKKKEITK